MRFTLLRIICTTQFWCFFCSAKCTKNHIYLCSCVCDRMPFFSSAQWVKASQLMSLRSKQNECPQFYTIIRTCDIINIYWTSILTNFDCFLNSPCAPTPNPSRSFQVLTTIQMYLSEQIQQGSSQVPQAPVTPSAPFYRHRGFLWRLSSLADFPGPFHGDIHRQSEPI